MFRASLSALSRRSRPLFPQPRCANKTVRFSSVISKPAASLLSMQKRTLSGLSAADVFGTDAHEQDMKAPQDPGITALQDRARVYRVGEGQLQGMISVQVSNPHIGDVFQCTNSRGEVFHGVTIHTWADIAWVLVDKFVEKTYSGSLSGHNDTGAIDLGIHLEPGDRAVRLRDPSDDVSAAFRFPTGPALLGRVVDYMGRPLDGKPAVQPGDAGATFRGFNLWQPDIEQRMPIKTPLLTGIKAVDTLTPIGKGQAMLVYGERGIGKRDLVLDVISNQVDNDVKCVYVVTEGGAKEVESVVSNLEARGAMANTTVVVGTAGFPPALMAPARHVAPDVGCSMAEYFRDAKQHAMVVYDELEQHCLAYSEMCKAMDDSTSRLEKHVLDRTLYSGLIQRSANLSADMGGGSLSSLVLLRTGDDAASPYEFMSVSDGQIHLSQAVKDVTGCRVPLEVGSSLSRLGSKARAPVIESVSPTLRSDLLQMVDAAGLYKNLDPHAECVLHYLCSQEPNSPCTPTEQAVGLHVTLAHHTMLASVGVSDKESAEFVLQFLKHFKETNSAVMSQIEEEQCISQASKAAIRLSVTMFASLEWNKRV